MKTGAVIIIIILAFLLIASVFSYERQQKAISFIAETQKQTEEQLAAQSRNVWDIISKLSNTKLQTL